MILALATGVRTVRESSVPGFSAASETQIKQALENNYDDTGPGAKGREYAYNTYKTLEEALVSYIDDPDTKLPSSERMKAINRLINAPKDYERYTSQPIREYPKSVADYTGYRQIPQIPPIVLKKNTLRPQTLYNPIPNIGVYNLGLTNVNTVTPKHTAQPQYNLENVHLPGPVTPVIPGFLPYLTANHQQHYNARAQFSTQGIYVSNTFNLIYVSQNI